eukprot:EG_transcript_13477
MTMVACSMACLGLVCSAVACALPRWSTTRLQEAGLWQVCANIMGEQMCVPYSQSDFRACQGWVAATAGMVILTAFAFLVIGVLIVTFWLLPPPAHMQPSLADDEKGEMPGDESYDGFDELDAKDPHEARNKALGTALLASSSLLLVSSNLTWLFWLFYAEGADCWDGAALQSYSLCWFLSVACGAISFVIVGTISCALTGGCRRFKGEKYLQDLEPTGHDPGGRDGPGTPTPGSPEQSPRHDDLLYQDVCVTPPQCRTRQAQARSPVSYVDAMCDSPRQARARLPSLSRQSKFFI